MSGKARQGKARQHPREYSRGQTKPLAVQCSGKPPGGARAAQGSLRGQSAAAWCCAIQRILSALRVGAQCSGSAAQRWFATARDTQQHAPTLCKATGSSQSCRVSAWGIPQWHILRNDGGVVLGVSAQHLGERRRREVVGAAELAHRDRPTAPNESAQSKAQSSRSIRTAEQSCTLAALVPS